MIVPEVFGFVNGKCAERVRSEAEEPLSGDLGRRGKGQPAPLSPASLCRRATHSFFSSGGLRFLRIDSPRISIRWAVCTRRSRMPSAMVGSPICSCQRETGNWE